MLYDFEHLRNLGVVVDKQKKQLIMVGVLLIVLIFAVMSSMKKKPANTAEFKAGPSAGIAPKLQAPAGPVAAPKPEEKKLNAQLERAKGAWSRDPFVAPSEKEYQMGTLQLKGISFDKTKGGFAFINNDIVKKGDTIGEYEVVDIEKNRVLLKKGNQSFYLAFPGQE